MSPWAAVGWRVLEKAPEGTEWLCWAVMWVLSCHRRKKTSELTPLPVKQEDYWLGLCDVSWKLPPSLEFLTLFEVSNRHYPSPCTWGPPSGVVNSRLYTVMTRAF